MVPERVVVVLGGVVQGVGFRPWAARRARARGLAGRVCNTPAGVEVELEGERPSIDAWLADLRERPPVGAHARAPELRWCRPRGASGFAIAPSRADAPVSTCIPPDAALCDACAAELFDPRSRRHRYAFTHCATCGPRASVVCALPFDRSRTTLAGFRRCAACRREYGDPDDRRHHAQMIACPECGPRLAAWNADGDEVRGDPIEAAAAVLAAGGAVALKGYGGFHLAVDATQPAAVARLRKRKGRPVKPFALLVPDVVTARRVARLSAEDVALLCGAQRPIVLAPRRDDGCQRLGVCPGVAPGSADLGLLLPYAPLHHLLLHGPGTRPGRDPARFRALVFTSANRSEEPTLHDDDHARARLADLAELVVGHDRRVARPSDDPVYRSSACGAIPIRLSRATAPRVLALPDGLRATAPLLALGSDLKSAPALVIGDELLLAEHVGDLVHVEAADALASRVAALCRLLGVSPQLAVHDRHPDSIGAQLARRLAPRQWAVQHHHAHALACLAEYAEVGPALAWVLDGAGYGADGSVWGGELLQVDGAQCTRRAHLETVPLPGGDAAAREPWRMAAVWLARAFPSGPPPLAWLRRHDAQARARVCDVAERGIRSPLTSSAGRLFDAAASLLDLCDRASHEGEAAAALEALAAAGADAAEPSARPAAPPCVGDARRALPVADLIARLARGRAAGEDRRALAYAFHVGFAERLAGEAAAHARQLGIRCVALSGGCFQNRLLLEQVELRVRAAGLDVRVHRRVPPNDGGLAVGQAIAALSASVGR